MADALHQIAVGGEHIGPMVDDIFAELGGENTFGNRHADCVAQALTEWARGRFDPRSMVVLRMPGGQRIELTEALQLVDRHRLDAEQMQDRVEQHRAVPGG